MHRLFLSLLILIVSATSAFAAKLEISIKGEGANGIVVIDLFEDVAPLHVKRIVELASKGKYDGIAFHRVIEGFMAQIYRSIEVLLAWREPRTLTVRTVSFLLCLKKGIF